MQPGTWLIKVVQQMAAFLITFVKPQEVKGRRQSATPEKTLELGMFLRQRMNRMGRHPQTRVVCLCLHFNTRLDGPLWGKPQLRRL